MNEPETQLPRGAPDGNGAAGASVLSAHGLRYRPSPAFELAVDALHLPRGSVLGLLGPNGSGKTTLLRLLGLLARPNDGAISLAGEPARYGFRGVTQRRRIATVFQKPMLLDTTVRCNVEAGLRFRGAGRHERRSRALHWLDRFGITHLADRHARRLSGGETRRVALARALVLEPALLLLDEPFNDLDLLSRQELQRQLRHVLADAHSAVVLVTHDLHDGLGLVDRLAVLIEGRLVQQGGVDAVLNRPQNRRIADLVGMTNLWPAVVVRQGREGAVHLQSGTLLTLPACNAITGQHVLVGVRPERVVCSSAAHAAPTSANADVVSFEATIIAMEPATPLTRVTARLDAVGGGDGARQSSDFVQLVDLPQRLHGLSIGAAVCLNVARQDLHVLPDGD